MQKTLQWLWANALAGCMDACIGALVGVVVFKTSGLLSIWRVACSACAALIPDLDQIWPILRGRVDKDHHASVMHIPVVVLPIATAIAWYFGGLPWAADIFLCVLWHYVHDTPPLGGGIRWFGPWGWEKMRAQPKHDEWLKENWMRISSMMMRELGLGFVALVAAAVIAIF